MTKYANIFKYVILLAVFLVATQARFVLFYQTGKDIDAYKRAVIDLLEGRNPYTWTVASYSNPDDPGNHGFAYLPGILYINTFLFLIYLTTNIPLEYLWKVPIFLADMGIGVLLVAHLYKKDLPALLFSLLVWFFHPYFYLKNNYITNDPIPIFFLFLALHFLQKDDVLTGAFYILSVLCKPFGIILFPIFLFKTKNKIPFLMSGAIVFFVASLPFLKNLSDLETYLRGALLIHSERFVQGRPFLYYISYYYKIEFFRIIPFKTYTFLATFSGWFVGVLILASSKFTTSSMFVVKKAATFLQKFQDKHVLSIFPFLTFYLFTPVLNRTYLIWFLPIFLVGTHTLSAKKKFLFYFTVGFYYLFYYFYLVPWKDGFHIWHP